MPKIIAKIRPVPAARPRITNNGTYMPESYVKYKRALKLIWQARVSDRPIDDPCGVEIVFWYPKPKSWSKARKESTKLHRSRPDIDNLVKGVLDALNGVAYTDDALVADICAKKRYGDGSDPAIHIHIYKLEDNDAHQEL